ncbi:adenylate/guanylate cyclase domain-containing protein [Granulosicoccus sp. 3-233]|uniref:adenylate/guanylate cyclase domain-containing protein n=1 Tax=Granulosicoccus sp. 3-233 TaxID=3417969 RepID=UPI003D3515BF
MNSKQEHRLRISSGLVIAFFLVLHLLNAGLGIISLSAMNVMGNALAAFWSIPVMQLLLYTAFIVHIGLMFVALYRRRSLRLPGWNLTQIGMALALPILLFAHVAGTRGTYEFLDIYRNYTVVVSGLWNNPSGVVRQYLLLTLAWTHMCIGIHFWLRHKPDYSRWKSILYPLCLVIPLLAALGFLRAGVESRQLPADTPAIIEFRQAISSADPDRIQLLMQTEKGLLWLFAVLLIAVLLMRALRNHRDRKRGGFFVTHTPSSRQLPARQGQTVLETLREAGIPHTAICGGRGRCTTCRVRIIDVDQSLPEPEELERRALQRVRAAPNVRLACQLKPQRDITITPLLQADVSAPAARVSVGVMGHEQKVACMFVDLRGSTRLAEQKLPYDVVFILNQFFIQLDEALRATGGHYATFNGDGLMALYGLDGDLANGCRKALAGAVQIQSRMVQLSEWLADELEEPLRVGIGIHCGDAIVGTMGPPDAPTVSALGDNINITARLEALTKEFECGLIVSEQALRQAGHFHPTWPRHTVHVRGRGKPLDIIIIDDLRLLQEVSLTPPAVGQ